MKKGASASAKAPYHSAICPELRGVQDTLIFKLPSAYSELPTPRCLSSGLSFRIPDSEFRILNSAFRTF